MTLTGPDLMLVGLAAVAGGFVNAIAGGGTLITFPMLTAVGVAPVIANITNTVALCPGYVGGTFAQRSDLAGQKRRLWVLLPAGLLGGVTGSVLLLFTNDVIFRKLVPWLILTAVFLLACQDRLRNAFAARQRSGRIHPHEGWAVPLIYLTAVYGGYFGAGLGVMTLAVLGLALEDSLIRLNALKQALSFIINIAAALFFLFFGKVLWTAAAVMAVGALGGGVLGGRVASKMRPVVLRWMVISVGLGVAAAFFFT